MQNFMMLKIKLILIVQRNQRLGRDEKGEKSEMLTNLQKTFRITWKKRKMEKKIPQIKTVKGNIHFVSFQV